MAGTNCQHSAPGSEDRPVSVVAVGLSQQSAPSDLFEQSSLMGDRWSKMLTELSHSAFVSEAVVLATCNRTEVYVRAERFHEAFHDISDALAVVTGTDLDDLTEHLYVHYARDAVAHLFSVSAGLQSVVVGEHEVLGQVRKAWDDAREFGSTGAQLNLLFQRAIGVGKRVRTETMIGHGTTSLSAAVVQSLSERRNLADTRVLLVGAGDVGRSTAAALRPLVADLAVTNRTSAKGAEVAVELDARAVDFRELSAAISAANLVVTATAAPGVVIDADVVEPREDDDLTIVDLAMPSDVATDVVSLEGVDLVRLVEIQQVANRGIADRENHRIAAEQLVAEELERYLSAASAQEVAPLVAALRRRGEAVRERELARASSKLDDLTPDQRRAVETATKRIVATLLHEPTVELKDAAGSPRGERLADSLREMFRLD